MLREFAGDGCALVGIEPGSGSLLEVRIPASEFGKLRWEVQLRQGQVIATPPGVSSLSLKVLEGMVPGAMLQIPTAAGGALVEVPDGVTPGGTLEVKLEPPGPPLVMTVQAPPGARPGDPVPVQTCDGLWHAPLPYGVAAGMPFNVRVPARLRATATPMLERPRGTIGNRARAVTRGVQKSALVVEHANCEDLSEHYETVRELGEGSFGKVVLVKDARTGQDRVRKVVNIEGQSQFVINLMLNEIESMRKLEHPNILQIIEHSADFDEEQIVMILEYVEGGSVEDMLTKRGTLPEPLVGSITYQLLLALCYCHANAIAHRDIKPDNIMVTERKGCGPDQYHCKLIDFGLAGEAKLFMVPHGSQPEPVVQGTLGTAAFMPPEVLAYQPYTTQADMWSTGSMTIILLTGNSIFEDSNKNNDKTFERIRNYAGPQQIDSMVGGQHMAAWRACSIKGKTFVKSCLEVDPRKRPTARAAMSDPWVEEHMPQVQKLSPRILKSLRGFLAAPAVTRCCSLIVATRLGVGSSAEEEELGAMFLAADTDRDGQVSVQDLEAALDTAGSRVGVDVEDLIEEADISHTGGMNYMEFVAVCLHDRFEFDELIRRAFHAIDVKRETTITVEEARPLFRERDAPILESLPQGGRLTLEEWGQGIKAWAEKAGASGNRLPDGGSARGQSGSIPASGSGGAPVQNGSATAGVAAGAAPVQNGGAPAGGDRNAGFMSVTVPAGAPPGSTLRLNTPSGSVMAVVPPGLRPGQTFNVPVSGTPAQDKPPAQPAEDKPPAPVPPEQPPEEERPPDIAVPQGMELHAQCRAKIVSEFRAVGPRGGNVLLRAGLTGTFAQLRPDGAAVISIETGTTRMEVAVLPQDFARLQWEVPLKRGVVTAAPPGLTSITITVSEGMGPGALLHVPTAAGSALVAVPEDVPPGTELDLHLDRPGPPKRLAVVVPSGMGAGRVFPANTPEGVWHATVPQGFMPGQECYLSIPARLGATARKSTQPKLDRAGSMGTRRNSKRAVTRGVQKKALVMQHDNCADLSEFYEEVRALGEGSFGTVVLVRDNRTGQERVRKVVDISGQSKFVISLMMNEIEAMRKLEHPNILQIVEHAADWDEEQIVMILEYIEGGSVEDMLERQRFLPEALVSNLLYQLLVALCYCHAHGIAHRDIKPENMMVTRVPQPNGGERYYCKLIDFGLAGEATLFVVPHGAEPEPVVQGTLGTAEYMPPEVLDFQPYTTQADMWSTGVTAVQLLTGKAIFDDYVNKDQNKVFSNIRRYGGPQFISSMLGHCPSWASCTQRGREFAKGCLEIDPRLRPTSRLALSDPWIQEHKPEIQVLNARVLESLKNYLSAQPVARCCSLVVVTRLGVGSPAEEEEMGSMFLAADVDRDGQVSAEDLALALEAAGVSEAEVEVDDLVEAANIGHSGGLTYMEFAAVCLHDRFELDELLRRSFHALDADRDGRINIEDAKACFRERDAPLLESLPQERPLTLEDWCQGVTEWGWKRQVSTEARLAGADGL